MNAARATVLVVTGSGRSGTSTAAGALKRLGLHLPQPEVEADETNPRGFYESRWVVDFHRELLNSVPVRTTDARPEAARLMHDATADPEWARRLADWLGAQLTHPQVLVKDPRAYWVLDLWRSVATGLDAEVVCLTMLRHPVEVAMSRDSAYLASESEEFRRRRATANIAAWVNGAFDTEAATRPGRRAFVLHADLLADWRTALGRAAAQTGVKLGGEPAEVDDFIDTGLHRARATWDELDLPADLRALAERVWELMSTLADEPHQETATHELEELRQRYVRMHDHAVAIALDHTKAREAHVRRRVKANLEKSASDQGPGPARTSPKGRGWGSTRRGSR